MKHEPAKSEVPRYHKALRRLLMSTPEELAARYIAEMNLLCTFALPGTFDMDIEDLLAKIDFWTGRVREEMKRHLIDWQNNHRRDRCSYAVFCLWAVIRSLKDCFDLKHYLLPDKNTGITGIVSEPPSGGSLNFADSGLHFIHGLLGPRRLGGCASMPVLFAAVARRLGYPVKLVLTVQHSFVRWETPDEAFNVEGTGPDYISKEPYEHYLEQPRPWTPEERAATCFLRPATAIEELASFMLMRSGCLRYNGQFILAYHATAIAHHLAPDNPMYVSEMRIIECALHKHGISTPIPKRYDATRTDGNPLPPFVLPLAPSEMSQDFMLQYKNTRTLQFYEPSINAELKKEYASC